MSVDAQTLGVIVAVVAPFLTYLVARRKLSGSIQTTEANTLWQEAREMREDLTKQLVDVREDCETLHDQVEKLRRELHAVTDERDRLARENVQLRERVAHLEQRVEDLASARGPAGPRGTKGDRGNRGDQGERGDAGR